MGEAPTVHSLGRRPSSCQAGTMDRCGGRGNSGPSLPKPAVIVGCEARAQDYSTRFASAQGLGHPAHGPHPLSSEKGFTMLQIIVRAQATVLAESQIFHRQLLRPISIYSRPTQLLSTITSSAAATTDTIMGAAHHRSPEV